jgi:hypothetical protein
MGDTISMCPADDCDAEIEYDRLGLGVLACPGCGARYYAVHECTEDGCYDFFVSEADGHLWIPGLDREAH